ncbi:MAG: teichoic acid biosynthesis protein [Myxococcales bacterium]|nr:teichoic acid biosynthesis protein [Myxococcales bacterium]
MRVLYGVVGEGLGHATRSAVVIEHLLAEGHQVHVVVSGRAYGFLAEAFSGHRAFSLDEIHGLSLAFSDGEMDLMRTVGRNLRDLPEGLVKNIEVYFEVAERGFRPEVVISDFESWAYYYGLNHQLPVISIDNMQIINRCHHGDEETGGRDTDFRLAKALVKSKLPGAYHYLITTFFTPTVRKERTSLVPPIVRAAVQAAEPAAGEHLLIYQSGAAAEDLLEVLGRFPHQPMRIYGLDRTGREGHLQFMPFSDQGFVEDLRTCKAVVASAGFSLIGEALHLGKPMLVMPLAGQFEQVMNGRYLAKEKYGAWVERLDAEALADFIDHLPLYQQALQHYPAEGNDMLFGLLDELFDDLHHGEPAPAFLAAPALGKYEV